MFMKMSACNDNDDDKSWLGRSKLEEGGIILPDIDLYVFLVGHRVYGCNFVYTLRGFSM